MTQTVFERRGGVLMHPSSLPGPYGIGSLGRYARSFADDLCTAGIRIWQILPLGPTGYGDSPYQCFSAFAGNPYLIDLETLIDQGLLGKDEIPEKSFPDDKVDFGRLIPFKLEVLRTAYSRFRDSGMMDAYRMFCEEKQEWLDDYALFMALKEKQGGKPWNAWPHPLKARDKTALAKARKELEEETGFQKFMQYIFFGQWMALKMYANERGISILGDIPLYVSADSSDAWTQPELFLMDENLDPVAVSGVPPDYFSRTGQLWGNPIFNWEAMKRNGFEWWAGRVGANMDLFDIVRIDHFRGLEAYWSVPYGEKTAVNGEWVKAPGMDLLTALKARFDRLPLVAEDLGVITPEVDAIRNAFGLPGMKILQFAFDSSEESEHIPHVFDKNTVVYTGTHDNDTVLGWVSAASKKDRLRMLEYMNSSGSEVNWDLIRLAWASVASTAVVPMQDIIGLGSKARMNLPGTTGGNWTWRMREGELTKRHLVRLSELNRIYGR